MSDMLTHVHALNPFSFINQPCLICRELLNQHKNPTRPSSGCSTYIDSSKAKKNQILSTNKNLPLLVVRHTMKHSFYELNCWRLNVKSLLRDITNISGRLITLCPGLETMGRERVFQYSALGFHLVSRLFPNCRPDWESDGDAVLGWQLCCVPAQSLQNKSQRFASPQHNLLQYWEEIVETKQ